MRESRVIVEDRKTKAFIKKLTPITNWADVQPNELIFHVQDNNIFNRNMFTKYDKENDIVYYTVYDKETKAYQEYSMSASNWYYYDSNVADDVEYEFKPKLWWSHNQNYPEDFWICVANNVQDLYERYVKEHGYEGTLEDWQEEYDYSLIDEIDDYIVNLV